MPAAIPLIVIINALRADASARRIPRRALGADAAQEFHLNEVDGIDVGVADVDGPADDRR